MARRRLAALAVLVVALAAAAALRLALPELIRRAAIARVQAMTGRVADVRGVDVALRQGRVTVHGFRLADRPGEPEPLARVERLDLRVDLPSLLRGRLWLHELVLRDSVVHVIRYPSNEFNLSELIRRSGEGGGVLELTIDRFAVVNGTALLEDRALPEPRTWRSERIEIEARDLSTSRAGGTAVGTSVTGGAPVSVRVADLRLYPIHLRAAVTVEGLDLAMARVYLPPGAPVVVDGGRATTSMQVALDARDGLRLDGTTRVEEVVLIRPGGERLARAARVSARLDGLALHSGGIALGRLDVDGTGAVLDPAAPGGARFAPTELRASVADLTWPLAGPARVDATARVAGRGSISVAGTLRPPTEPSDLRVRVLDLELAPWARFVPAPVQVTGVARADLRVNEPLGAGMPARVRGSVAVRALALTDARGQRVARAGRVEATALRVDWPTRLDIGRLLISEPRVTLARDRAGDLPVRALFAPAATAGGPETAAAGTPPAPGAAPAGSATAGGAAPGFSPPPVAIAVAELAIRGGTLAWQDDAVAPPARLAISRVDATVTGAGWPPPGPLGVRITGQLPGGGELGFAGRVALGPLEADGRLTARDADLAPYQAYVPAPATVSGRADLDLAVRVPATPAAGPTVRGRATVARLDVRDGERTVLRADRATASGLDVEWPRRVAARRLELEAPWILLERDESGALPLRALMTPAAASASPGGAAALAATPARAAGALALTVDEVVAAGGGARIVDRSVTPFFAVDLSRLAFRVTGLSTTDGPPAQVELAGRVGGDAALALRGTVGAAAPLRVDLAGELHGFAVPRTNPYLIRYVAWQAAQGALATSFECRIDGDALAARTEVRLSRLAVVRAGGTDESQARVGLPLGLIVALMRDRRGDIRLALPISGRLGDPRFDFGEAIWSAVRTVAVKAMTLPVSWIGRLRVGGDSRVERIEVDPIRFQAGGASLTPDGQAQVARVAAFLAQVSDVRMKLAPVVSAGDLAVLRREARDAAVARTAAEARITPEEAAARLFRERLPDRPVPADADAVLAALVDAEASPAHAPALAARRLQTLRAALAAAGVPPARFLEAPPAERPAPGAGTIELDVVEPESPRRSEIAEVLRRVGGAIAGAE